MSTASATIADQVEQSRSAPTRLFSLDLFRGITMAAMVVVNNQTSEQAYWPLRHAAWNGCTPTDLIFPFFLFIIGVSMLFSFAARLQRGESRRKLLLHTFRRSLILFFIGLALNGMASLQPSTWRIPGVLQRIAIVYCIASLITLYSGTRARVLWIASLTVGYWMLMRFVPVPGHGVPGVDLPLLHPDYNLAAYIDRKLMLGHMWEKTRDPEGLLSTIPSIATALCGVLTGQWLQTKRTPTQKVTWMLAAGALAAIAGEVWGRWFPLNKNLWTSSYVLFTAGAALICLAMLCWITDIKLHRGPWTKPFLVFGTNAIVAYVFSQLIGGWFGWDHLFAFPSLASSSPALASLMHSLLILAITFLPLWWMYRKKILVRI